MKKKHRNLVLIFIFSFIAMGANQFLSKYIDNVYIQWGSIVFLSMILAFGIYTIQKDKNMKKILDSISRINELDFKLPEDDSLSGEEKEKIYNLYKEVRTNLKTQVEISTEIFNVCEELAASTLKSLNSSELISSSVDVAENNITEQSEMLKTTNDLADKISSSMESIERDINDKIQFISDSISTAQNGIKSIDDIEDRIKNTKSMVGNTSNKIVDLRNYFDEVVGFVDLINTISNQTKMLSLNASIEAARAGEHGKGFSIVAMEVGKLADETESVSKKIEDVINNLKNEIHLISSGMEEEINYMEENAHVIEDTNKEFQSIIDTLNSGKESLEEIKNHTSQNTKLIEDINLNVEKIADFAAETSTQMLATTEQAVDQHNRCIDTNNIAEEIRRHVYDMQQFVVGRAMEEKMLKQAYSVKEFFVENKNPTDSSIKQLINEVGVDAIYVTDKSGVVEYANEKSAIGLNLYQADPTFLQFKKTNKEYIVTPIKKRVEDGKLFKFLTLSDKEGRLFEVGLGLSSLIKDI